MPRQSRIDAAGAVHHIIVRGIERSDLFECNADRDHFVHRLGNIINETETICYAWALMNNHFHLLLRTGRTPISTVMRRLQTGYALWYNRRHKRAGHLFQNRYKSILCQEDAYLLELVRYIHLNPLRAGLVKSLEQLDAYKYSGHSVLTGAEEHSWQETDGILSLFGKRRSSARRAYRAFVERGIAQGNRSDLVGGGLIRSAGGWEGVQALKKAKTYQRSDERILGDSDFVSQVLAETEEKLARSQALRASGIDREAIAQRIAALTGIKPDEVWAKGKYPRIVEARSLYCYWMVRELGVNMSELGRELGLSITSVSKSVERGQHLAETRGVELLDS
jgi:putative transposase